MQQIILVRNTETRAIVYTEEFEQSTLSSQQLAQITSRKVVELEVRYVGAQFQVVDGTGTSADDFLRNYPEYRPANWPAGRRPH